MSSVDLTMLMIFHGAGYRDYLGLTRPVRD
jgi:hypothetical protein